MLDAVAGQLLVVATPLGNLDDISPRGVAALRGADRILCEDTRRTAKLLAHHDIRTPLLSCHRFNEHQRVEQVLQRLRAGECLALVSDSGTPVIADPGAQVVRAALDAGFEVHPVPGPSAVTTLLSVSGLPADRYVFDGFLPHRAGERRRRLRELGAESRTLVFFESPHRIRDTLADIATVLGERRLVLGRELTKRFETILRGSVSQVARQLDATVRGEMTLIVGGAGDAEGSRDTQVEQVRRVWRAAVAREPADRRAALRIAARELGMKKPELYRLLAEIGESEPADHEPPA